MAVPLKPGAVFGVLKEVKATADRPILVSGTLAEQLAQELGRGGDAAAIRVVGAPDDVEAMLRVVGDSLGEEDERMLKLAHRARVATIVVAAGREAPSHIPFVLATDVVRVEPGHGFPVETIAQAVADKLGEKATSLARRLPVLRPAVCARLIESFSQKNGIVGAAVFVPGVDLPVLTLNQIRMVLRICAAYGLEIDAQRAPELVATVGVGLGFRALARELLDLVPVFGWAVKGAVAYAGTRAIGEATVRYCEAKKPLPRRVFSY
jgi:uncharacterized protein (DUF697 family)